MTKRAIALSGGGPAVGIEIGALEAFEQFGVEFDVFSCACVGSWVGCLYNSLPSGQGRMPQVRDFFSEQIFLPDDIYESYPINYKVFRTDYRDHLARWMEKVMDPTTYKHLVLPERIVNYSIDWLRNPPRSVDEFSQRINEGLALNPWARFAAQLQWKVGQTGASGLVNSGGFVETHIDFKHLFASDKTVYLNAYNLTQNRMEIFVNRGHAHFASISADALMAGSSVLHYTATRQIEGSDDRYCEGAVVNTVSLNHLLDEHPDLDEIWVVKIADYKQVKPPSTPLESALLGVMLPFDTISDNDIALFGHALRKHNKKTGRRTRLINIPMAYERVNYHWTHSNLHEGIAVGFEGTEAAIARHA